MQTVQESEYLHANTQIEESQESDYLHANTQIEESQDTIERM